MSSWTYGPVIRVIYFFAQYKFSRHIGSVSFQPDSTIINHNWLLCCIISSAVLFIASVDKLKRKMSRVDTWLYTYIHRLMLAGWGCGVVCRGCCYIEYFNEIQEQDILHKNTERHTAHIIISWPNPKQWVTVHTSSLMMIIRQSIYILSIITREMCKLKTHNPTYCIMDNWENVPDLTHSTNISDRHFISSMFSDKFA